jgi:hypothetical protein
MSIELLRPLWVDLRYFGADRFFSNEAYREFIGGKINSKEIVSFDGGLHDIYEIESFDSSLRPNTEQIIAVILRPQLEPIEYMKIRGFTFCGYDLIEEETVTSAITNCGGGFDSIPYEKLTDYGLLPTYEDAVLTQLALIDEVPEDPHAYCMICEIWRKIVNA